MDAFTDEASAAANKFAGTVKIGKVTGNVKLEAEGEVQQLEGAGQNVRGSVKGALGDKL